jgi:hypothetical protein
LRRETKTSLTVQYIYLENSDPKEKKTILEKRLARLEYQHFEKPSKALKDQITLIRKNIKELNRQINALEKGQDEEKPIVIVQKSNPHMFGSHMPKTGELALHTRTIPKLMNLWSSMGSDELQYALLIVDRDSRSLQRSLMRLQFLNPRKRAMETETCSS